MSAEQKAGRITVVIPCFNDGSFLLEAVASIREAEPIGIIVVDDASTDPTTRSVMLDLQRDHGVTLVTLPQNQGVAAAIDTGIRGATTPYAFVLGADDLVEPGSLAVMADRLDLDDRVGVVWGRYTLFGARSGEVTVPPFDPWRITYVNRWPGVAMIRRRDYQRVGGLRPGVLFEDWDLWMAFAAAGIDGVALADTPSFRYRIHPSSARRHSRGTVEFGKEYRLLRRRHATLFAQRRDLGRSSPLGPATKARERFGLWLLLATPPGLRWTHSVAGDAARRVMTLAPRPRGPVRHEPDVG